MRSAAVALAIAVAGPWLAGGAALAEALPGDPGFTPPVPAEGGQVNITVIAEERDLRSVVREIERKAGVNIYVDDVIEEVVSVRLVNLPWRNVLDVVARAAGVEIEEPHPRLFMLTQPPRVFMEFADADIRVVLDLLARQAGKNIVIASDVTGNVTLNLRNVHWWRALDTIVKTAGYVAVREDDGDLIRVVRPEALRAQLTTRVYPLRYLRPPDDYKAAISGRTQAGESSAGELFVANPTAPRGLDDFTLFAALQEMVSAADGEQVQYNVESNSFIVNATATKHQEIQDLLRRIDVEPEQVFVDVKFITTTNSNFWRAGLRLGDPGDPDSAGIQARLGLTGPTPAGPGVPAGTGGTLGQFPFVFGKAREFFSAFHVPAVLDFGQMNVLAQFVDIDNNSKVTQAPTLLSLNSRPAVIFVGEKVPFAEQRANVDQQGSVTVTLQEATDSPQDVGFTLFITPHIVRDTDQIILTVIPRVTRLTGTGSPVEGLERFEFRDPVSNIATFIDLPRVFDQTVVTSLLVRDNQTAVIGGLMQETILEIEQRVPILSRIPILGSLFTFRKSDYTQENQIIFITPRIVRSRSDSSELFSRQYQVFQESDFFYQKYLKEGQGERSRPKGRKAPADDQVEVEDEAPETDEVEADAPPMGAGADAPLGEPHLDEPEQPDLGDPLLAPPVEPPGFPGDPQEE